MPGKIKKLFTVVAHKIPTTKADCNFIFFFSCSPVSRDYSTAKTIQCLLCKHSTHKYLCAIRFWRLQFCDIETEKYSTSDMQNEGRESFTFNVKFSKEFA